MTAAARRAGANSECGLFKTCVIPPALLRKEPGGLAGVNRERARPGCTSGRRGPRPRAPCTHESWWGSRRPTQLCSMSFRHFRGHPHRQPQGRGCGSRGPTFVADTGVAVPGVEAAAVLRAGAGGARVFHVTAVLHPDLEGVVHVQRGDVGGRLAHPHTLRRQRAARLRACRGPDV